MKDEIKEILDNIRRIIKSNRENDFNRIIYDCDSMEKLLDYITNLQEIQKEHSIMKQFIYENGLWERFLNDDRFIEHLRGEENEQNRF